MPELQFVYEIQDNVNYEIASFLPQDRLLPKILYFYKSARSNKITPFLESFLKYLSDFMIKAKSNFEIGNIQMIKVLAVISYFATTNHRFLPATLIKEGAEQRPGAISWKHYFLKTLIFPIKMEPREDKLREIKVSNCLDAKLSALAISSLFSAPTRRGTELRQVAAQSLAPFIFDDGGDTAIKELLADLMIDTYGWFSDHLIENYALYSMEVSRRVPKITRKCWNWDELFDKIRSIRGMDELLNKIIEINGKRDFLFGRLIFLRDFLKKRIDDNEKYNRIITVATGQWNISQALMLSKLLEKEGKLDVLFTHNSAEMALIEKDLRNCASKNLQINYHFISETDAYLIQKVLNGLMDKDESVYVLAQGPSMIAVPLYMKCRKRRLSCDMI